MKPMQCTFTMHGLVTEVSEAKDRETKQPLGFYRVTVALAGYSEQVQMTYDQTKSLPDASEFVVIKGQIQKEKSVFGQKGYVREKYVADEVGPAPRPPARAAA